MEPYIRERLVVRCFFEATLIINIINNYNYSILYQKVKNFHAPKSTGLMLAAAFADWNHLKPAYEHAVESGYKLLSYGDSMFIY